MHRTMLFVFMAMVLALGSGQAFSQAWTGEGDLGFSQASGNSETETLTAAVGINYDPASNWKHSLALSALNSSQNDERSAENYGLDFNSILDITPRSYLTGNLRFLADNFSGFETQTAVTVTIGTAFVDNGTVLFNGEIGAGFRNSELITGEEEDETIATGKLTFNWAISETTNIDSHALVETGEENTYSEGGVGLRVAISEALGLRVAYLIINNSDAPEDTVSTDRLTTLGINYKF